jgi:NADH dehydrogenase
MNRFVRRGFLGAFAGATAGAPMLFLGSNRGLEFAMAIPAASLYGACVPPVRDAYADNIMAAASMGIPLWGIANVIVLPWFSSGHMAWSAAGMESHFGLLVEWVLFGALLGAILQIAGDVAGFVFGPEITPTASPSANPIRIVILGGRFGGMKTAEYLERELPGHAAVSISLVSETNALLFTPMLAEVAGDGCSG